MRHIALILGLVVIVAAAVPAAAQSPAQKPGFEVASVKPAPSDTNGGGYRFESGGRMVVTNFTVKDLIVVAWDIQRLKIQGGPTWIDSDRYNIEARAEGNPSEVESRVMLQTLLTDRFRLTVHKQTRELPKYALVMAESDGRWGAELVPARMEAARLRKTFPTLCHRVSLHIADSGSVSSDRITPRL